MNWTVRPPEPARHGAQAVSSHPPRTVPSICRNPYGMVHRQSQPPEPDHLSARTHMAWCAGHAIYSELDRPSRLNQHDTVRGHCHPPQTGPSVPPNPQGRVRGAVPITPNRTVHPPEPALHSAQAIPAVPYTSNRTVRHRTMHEHSRPCHPPRTGPFVRLNLHGTLHGQCHPPQIGPSVCPCRAGSGGWEV